jgi:hypothetical protein
MTRLMHNRWHLRCKYRRGRLFIYYLLLIYCSDSQARQALAAEFDALVRLGTERPLGQQVLLLLFICYLFLLIASKDSQQMGTVNRRQHCNSNRYIRFLRPIDWFLK